MNKYFFQLVAVMMCFLIVTAPVSSFLQPIGSVFDAVDGRALDLSEETDCFVDEASGDVLCVGFDKGSNVALGREAISTSVSNPSPGQTVFLDVSFFLGSYFDITSAEIYVEPVASSNRVLTIPFANRVRMHTPNTNGQYTFQFNAPRQPGQYVVFYEVKGTTSAGGSEQVFASGSTNMVVGGSGCTVPSDTIWRTTQTVSNGVWQTRTVYSVNANCVVSSRLEERTFCNEGYYPQGASKSTNTAPGFTNCLPGGVLKNFECGFCVGDTLVPYQGYRMTALPEMSVIDNLLFRLGLKSFDRRSSLDEPCTNCETVDGDQLLPYTSEVICDKGIARAHPDYFKPKITGVYINLADSKFDGSIDKDDSMFLDITEYMSRDGTVALPRNLIHESAGFKEGGYLEVIVGVSNRDAKVYNKDDLSPELNAELDEAKVGWLTRTAWHVKNYWHRLVDKRVYTASREQLMLDPDGFEEGREAVVIAGVTIATWKFVAAITAVGAASRYVSGRASIRVWDGLRDGAIRNAKASLDSKQSNAITMNPVVHRAIVEVGIYSPDVARVVYDYAGRERLPTDLRIPAPTFQLRESCQKGESEAGFVSAATLFLAPPYLHRGEVKYSDYGADPARAAQDIITATGAVTDGYVMLHVKIPQKGDMAFPAGRSRMSNYNEEGNYVLSVAVFDRCPDGDLGISYTYIDKLGSNFNINPGPGVDVPGDLVCCRYQNFLGLWGTNYYFTPRSECFPRNIVEPDNRNWDKCKLHPDVTTCYYCVGDTYRVRNDLTREWCLNANVRGFTPTHFLSQAEARNTCGLPDIYAMCYSCDARRVGDTEPLPGFEECPNEVVDGMYYSELLDDEWFEVCSREGFIKNADKCYQCDDSDKGYSLYTRAGQFVFDFISEDPAGTCRSLGDDIYHITEITNCDSISSVDAIVNPDNVDQWCIVPDADTTTCVTPSLIYDRKDSLHISDLSRLEVLLDARGYKTTLTMQEVMENKDLPICIAGVGSVMCEDGSSCIRAMRAEHPEYRDNRLVFDALRQYSLKDSVRFWQGIAGGVSRWFTGDASTDRDIEQLGICVKDRKGLWESLTSFVSDLFNIREDSPAVVVIILIFFGLLAYGVWLLANPPKKKNQVGGDFF